MMLALLITAAVAITIAELAWLGWHAWRLNGSERRRAYARNQILLDAEWREMEANFLHHDYVTGILDYGEFVEGAKRLGLSDSDIDSLLSNSLGNVHAIADRQAQRCY